jgi:predicted  nucleic acid-binding Zn-ribbon protein
MGKKKGKKAKKLTQEQQDILGLARQVMRLEEEVRDMKALVHALRTAVSSVELRLMRGGEALAGRSLT